MSSTEGVRGRGARVATGLLWSATVFEALLMSLAGAAKFVRPDVWTGYFALFGYPEPFAYVVGAVEVGAALLLLVPRLAAWAASVLVVVMLGALHAVLTHESGLGPGPPLLHLGFLAVILTARWDRRWRPGRRD